MAPMTKYAKINASPIPPATTGQVQKVGQKSPFRWTGIKSLFSREERRTAVANTLNGYMPSLAFEAADGRCRRLGVTMMTFSEKVFQE